MGTLDKTSGSVKRQIKIVDLDGLTPAQIESSFNTNFGLKGWRIIQVVVLGGKNYLVAEKEV